MTTRGTSRESDRSIRAYRTPGSGASPSLGSMDPAWLVLVSAAVGAVVGAGAVVLAGAAIRTGRRAVALAAPQLPEGIALVLAALPSPAVLVDASNNVLKASPGALALGFVRGRDLAHPELLALIDRSRRNDAPTRETLVLPRGRFGEDRVHVEVRVSAVDYRLHLLVAEDQTEAMRLAEVRRDFLLNVSHELKTPIGAVGLLAEALAQASDDAAQVRRFAEQLGAESDRLTQLVKEIIDLSRLQSLNPMEQAERVSVQSIVATALARTRVLAGSRRIALSAAKRLPGTVYGSPELLVTAVQNLVLNAIQYSPDGAKVAVGSSIRGETVELKVIDQGVGIPEADIDRIFERFFRVDGARSRNTGGSGLGLSIVKHIVVSHGGQVRAWSKPGQGSTFTIALPELTALETGSIGVPA